MLSEGYSVEDGRFPKRSSDIFKSMREAIADANLFVILLSSGSVTSSFVRSELDVALLYHGARARQILPVLLDPIDAPGDLDGIKPVPLWDATESEAKDRILTAVRAAIGSPPSLTKPPYPGRKDQDVPSWPFGARERGMIQRVPELNKLWELFQRTTHSDRGARVVAVVGPDGSGKTTLARQYAARHSDHYRSVTFLSGHRGDLENKSARVRDMVGPQLVVLDDVDGSARVAAVVERLSVPDADIMLLSNRPIDGVDRFFNMLPFTPSEALSLVSRSLPFITSADAERLVNSAGLSPRAIQLALDVVAHSGLEPSEAIASLARSVSDIPANGATDSVARSLASTFLTRFQRTNSLTAAAEAETLLRRSVELSAAETDARLSLAGLLLQRHKLTGAPEDLDESVALLREALRIAAPSDPERVVMLSNLAAALGSRAEERRSAEDLDESVALLREALAISGPGGPERAVILSNLAAAIRSRSGGKLSPNDLDESVALLREALESVVLGDPDRAVMLSNLAAALRSRAEVRRSPEDLDESVALLREALSLTGPDDPERAVMLSNLAAALRSRAEEKGSNEDLIRSVGLLREALEILPPNHPERAVVLSNLSAAERSYARALADGTSRD
ncbi:TIR domain-containing protein [Leifsonia poae]|uniref:P-loop NTPase n=1 Tax=Leifsonia poae TaxID=110933 RepID=UPI003D67234D